ncbi:LysR family transcriptional regulator [Devosia sp. D6-9]|nr:LysR family transcriptional regulator [Devosia sp. D6-9]
MDWNLIRAFLATAETGSLSAAARELKLTQPTLSRQVSALEASLGILLFDRVGRSLVLTPSGKDLLVHVRRMGEAAEELALVASGQAQSVEGLVKISASDIVAAYVLPLLLRQLHERAPGIRVEVVASNGLSDILRREADIAIRHVRPAQPDLVARRCRDSAAHLYAARSYLVARGRPERVEDLATADFVGFFRVEDLLAALRDERGLPLTVENFHWSANSFVVALEMVRQGLGIGVVQREAAERHDDIVQVLPELDPFPIPVWLATHAELHTSRRIRLVFDFLAEMLG